MPFAIAAYVLWGIFPAFFPLLTPAAPLEIIGHRIVWTAVVMSIIMSCTKTGWSELRRASVRTWGWLGLASVLVATNWLVYVIAVNSNHVADAALGYYINPLVNVLLGLVFLSERLRPLQKTSITVAATAVVMLTIIAGQPPVQALMLAFSFGFYGLVKKRVDMSAMASLTAETLILAPVAAGYLLVLEARGTGTFGHISVGHSLLLMTAGLVTAVPLLLFGIAARRIQLSTIGMLQYLTPTMQMLWAVFVTREEIAPLRWVAFGIIWVAVALYFLDILRFRSTNGRRKASTGEKLVGHWSPPRRHLAGQKPTAPETPKTVPSSRKIIFSGDLETINERIHNTTAAATRVRRLESLRFFFIPNDNSQSRHKISAIPPSFL